MSVYHTFFQKYGEELDASATGYKYQVEDGNSISRLFEVAVARAVQGKGDRTSVSESNKSFCCHLVQALYIYAFNGLLAAIRKKVKVDGKIVKRVCLCFESVLQSDLVGGLSTLITLEQWTKLVGPFFDSCLAVSFEYNKTATDNDSERVYCSIQAKVLSTLAAYESHGFSKSLENVSCIHVYSKTLLD